MMFYHDVDGASLDIVIHINFLTVFMCQKATLNNYIAGRYIL